MPVALAPLKAHHLPEKLAGKWIFDNDGYGVNILTNKPIVIYYAKGRYRSIAKNQLYDVIEHAKKTDGVYLAGYSHVLRKIILDFTEERAEKELIKVKTFKGKNKTFLIYRFPPTWYILLKELLHEGFFFDLIIKLSKAFVLICKLVLSEKTKSF